jgi:hypothetical protein
MAYGMDPVFMVVGTFIFPVQHLGPGRNVALLATFLLSVTSFARKVISSNSAKFLLKSSSHNNLVAMAATVVWNYNETDGFSRCGPGLQSVFMNGRVHHYMRIASSTSPNCGISYFKFDDIASLAGSADVQNVDPLILSDICQGFRNENPHCTDLHFIGVKARARAEGINVIPRMVD